MTCRPQLNKCLIDLEKGEQLRPNNLDSFLKDVHSKTNYILDWQVHNKKISEIEKKLKDKEYYNFVKYKADEEVNEINQKYLKKKEEQHKYLADLQQQEKFYKLLKREESQKIHPKDSRLNHRGSVLDQYTSAIPQRNQMNSSVESSRMQHHTIDLADMRDYSPERLHNISVLNAPKYITGR